MRAVFNYSFVDDSHLNTIIWKLKNKFKDVDGIEIQVNPVFFFKYSTNILNRDYFKIKCSTATISYV